VSLQSSLCKDCLLLSHFSRCHFCACEHGRLVPSPTQLKRISIIPCRSVNRRLTWRRRRSSWGRCYLGTVVSERCTTFVSKVRAGKRVKINVHVSELLALVHFLGFMIAIRVIADLMAWTHVLDELLPPHFPHAPSTTMRYARTKPVQLHCSGKT
jgi:hypothetical protein